MSGSKLLEQAIVDAQALRDSAYKSAQAALLEKFAPQVKEAVQKLLEQEEEDELGAATPSPTDALAGGQSDAPLADFGGAPPDESNKGYVAGTAGDLPLAATDGEKLCPCPDDDEEVSLEINLADLADQLDLSNKEDEPGNMGIEQTPLAMGGSLQENLELESIELEEDTLEELAEVDLDKVLDEVSGDIEVGSGYEGLDDPKQLMRDINQAEQELRDALMAEFPHLAKASEDKVQNMMTRYKLVNGRLMKVNDAEIFTPGSSDEPAGPFTTTEEELSSKQKKIAGAAPPANKITGADFAALRSGKDEKSIGLKESKTKDLLKASQVLLKEVENKDAKINKLLEENKTFASTIKQMSDAFKKLEEVNLLNARLFYENQILKSASLNERQKTHIVEAVSKADSVGEAKTIYETLINSVGGTQKDDRAPKSLNEAISKKSSFRLPHKQTEQPADPNKDRWLKLAGIK
jgi:transcription initiation factor IIF auxiliary subunit